MPQFYSGVWAFFGLWFLPAFVSIKAVPIIKEMNGRHFTKKLTKPAEMAGFSKIYFYKAVLKIYLKRSSLSNRLCGNNYLTVDKVKAITAAAVGDKCGFNGIGFNTVIVCIKFHV